MSKQKNNMNHLLAAIKRQPIENTPTKIEPVKPEAEEAEPEEQTTALPRQIRKKAQSRKGGPVQFWMHDEDRKLVRELSAWLAGQGLRPTDSMVIRAALRQAKTGGALIEAYWNAAKLDGRLKRD
jgi:hypothetical protein